MGISKALMEKVVIAASRNIINDSTTVCLTRYGNVMGSRGSVIPFFKSLADEGKPLPITDLRMTRFWISIEQAVKFVVDSLDIMTGGELYVPRIPSMKITDLAKAVAPNAVLVDGY